MISSDNFPVKFEMDGKSYLLSRSELRAIDSKDPSRSYTVPLNELNPNFYHRIRVSIFVVISLAYFTIGLALGLVSLLSGARMTDTIATQLVLFSVVLAITGYRIFQAMKDYPYYYFNSMIDGNKSYAIAFSRKDKQKTLEFIQLVAKRVREATLSNRAIINLLGSYHLLSQIEWSQLDASIKQKEVNNKSNESIIINLHTRRS